MGTKLTLDRWGIFLSGLCLVHCLLTPIIIFLIPWLEAYLREEIFHALLFIIILPLAFITFYSGHKIHRSKRPIILGTLGIAFLASDLILPESMHEIAFLHTGLTIFGSLLLVGAHYFNWHCHCHHDHHDHPHIH